MLTSSLHSHTANTGPLDSLDTQNSGTVDNEVVGDASESDPDVEKNTVDDAWGDPNLVGWNGPNDAENPKNWSFGRKWGAIAIVSAFTFISPVSSSMVAPALPILKAQFHITNSVESQIFMSIFVLAYAVGPLALGPLSEIYGRAPVLQLANLWFLVFNTACGAAKNTASMAVFRFLAGLGGSAPLSVGGGTLGDLFEPKDRGKAIAIYSLMPLLAPALGPIAGGFIAEDLPWPWIFYSVSIFDAFIQILGFFFLQETYMPVLLQRKKNRLIKKTNNQALHTQYDNDGTHKLSTKFRTSFTRPFILLFTQPIVQVCAVYTAIVYGMTYLLLSTFSLLYTTTYHEPIGISGLNYISIAIGCYIGAQTSAFLTDRIYRRLAKLDKEGKGRPEFRIPFLLAGSALVPVGLLWYGWAAEAHTPWIVPDIGIAVYSVGVIVVSTSLQAYILDTYTRYAASAFAATGFLRSLCGFSFPLFAPAMYSALGNGWGNSVLALVAIIFGFVGPIVIWRYGRWLRAKSPFAAGE